MHSSTPATAAHHGRSVSLTRPLMLALVLALAACKGGGDGKGMDGKKDADKGPEAVPVEVTNASRRSIAASYTGTAALEARGEAQVVAKTSGVALAGAGRRGPAGPRRAAAGAAGFRSRAHWQVAQSDAQMRKLESNYARAQQLASQKMVSANDLDQIKLRPGERAGAATAWPRWNCPTPTSSRRSPAWSRERSIKPGNFVQINTPIIRIVDVSRLEATLNVPERELETLQAGPAGDSCRWMRCRARPSRARSTASHRWSIPAAAPSAWSAHSTAAACCSRACSAASGSTTTSAPNALVMPRMALLDDGSEPAVYTVA